MPLFLIASFITVTGFLAHRLHVPFWMKAHPHVALALTVLALGLSATLLRSGSAVAKGAVVLILGTALMGLGAYMNFFPLLFHQIFIVLLLILGVKSLIAYFPNLRKMRHK